MTAAIDTNIFIYAHHDFYRGHVAALAFLTNLLACGEIFFIGWQVYYEYLRITTHPRIHNIPHSILQAAGDMDVYFSHPSCRVLQETPDHHRVLKGIVQKLPTASGNFVHDCHYAALLKENGLNKIVTADMDFRKFDFLDVINPMTST